MKENFSIVFVFVLCFCLLQAGCQTDLSVTDESSKISRSENESSVYVLYSASKIEVMPLTEFVNGNEIKVYVNLLDCFDCQIKSAGVFRFELYQKVIHSAEPKGRRVKIWSDIDLIEPAENNRYWRDFLRAYEFNLDFGPAENTSYILQVTCFCPNERRLTGEFVLE